MRNEIKRIHNRWRDEKDKITLTTLFINTLRNNDYPISITRHLNNYKSRKLHTPANTCFRKLPHFREIITKEIRRAIYKEEVDIQMANSGTSRQYLTNKKKNTVTACTLANCSRRDPNTCQKTYSIYCLISLKCHCFYIGITIGPQHIRIKEQINTQTSSFHKHLIIYKKCYNFPLK